MEVLEIKMMAADLRILTERRICMVKISMVQDTVSDSGPKTTKWIGKHDKATSNPSQSAAESSSKYEEDIDDFDPRGTSTKPSSGNSNQVDLFGKNLIGDLLDAQAPAPADNFTVTSHPSEIDLFSDADFVSAKPQPEVKESVDLFALQPTSSSAASSTIDLFSASDPVVRPKIRLSKSDHINTNAVDPFSAVPLNTFDSSDPFGTFVSHADPVTEPNENATNGRNQEAPITLDKSPVEANKPTPKKDNFQVRSGIWADSLSRGLIDLNITAPKKVNLADVGIVGGLTDGSDVKEKGATTFYMGRAIGQGTKLGQSGFMSTTMGGDDIFSSHQNYQFGSFEK